MKNYAILKPECPFFTMFNQGRVPIKNWLIPNQANCEGGGGKQDVYMVDLDALTPVQLEAVIKKVIEQCDPSIPPEIARKEIMARGLPLRAKFVSSTTSDCAAFL